ncbi:MAG TPA: hypothetical protein VFM05_04730, partial [Candidatus Saccharimonadales bacterium]|nr:hypothetical protein [Candidatus Saccharimonadales bacterium]
RALACTTGAFLLVGLCATTRDLATHFCLVRAKARIRHLPDVSLVHQIYINGGFEDCRGEFYLAQLLAFQI